MRQANNLGLWRTGRPVESSIASAVAAPSVASDAPILVRPESIRRDGGTQMRAALDVATVHEYHDLIRDAGGVWPFRDPVRLVHDGAVYWLVDGFHRLQAWTMHYGDPAPGVPAIVVSGDQRAAVLAAVGANADHGLRRSDADKRIAVDRLLAVPEWSAWSDGEIARRCAVSRPFVSKRREVLATSSAVAGSIGNAAPRTYTNRHGGQSVMRTNGIAESNKARSAAGGLASGKLGGASFVAADDEGAAVVQSSAPSSRASNPDLGKCRVCHRPLTDPVSAASGVGPCCAAKLAAGGGDDLAVGGDLLAAVHLHLTALVDALPALRTEFRHDPTGIGLVAKLQAAVVPAAQYVGAKMTAEG
jgi:hypothetical protein